MGSIGDEEKTKIIKEISFYQYSFVPLNSSFFEESPPKKQMKAYF